MTWHRQVPEEPWRTLIPWGTNLKGSPLRIRKYCFLGSLHLRTAIVVSIRPKLSKPHLVSTVGEIPASEWPVASSSKISYCRILSKKVRIRIWRPPSLWWNLSRILTSPRVILGKIVTTLTSRKVFIWLGWVKPALCTLRPNLFLTKAPSVKFAKVVRRYRKDLRPIESSRKSKWEMCLFWRRFLSKTRTMTAAKRMKRKKNSQLRSSPNSTNSWWLQSLFHLKY